MATADEIRDYCVSNIVEPARRRGECQVRIRAGDVHEALGLNQRFPAVVSALGADKFCAANGLTRTNIEGPLNGANTVLVFALG